MTDELRALNVRVEALLGDDLTANTNERMERATYPLLDQWDLPRFEYLRSLLSVDDKFLSSNIMVWKYREGQPWQADLEKHVSEWRDVPRNFCGDIGLCMEPGGLWERIREYLLMQPGLRQTQSPPWEWDGHIWLGNGVCGDWYVEILTVDGGMPYGAQHADTPAEAIVRAFVSVIEKENADAG